MNQITVTAATFKEASRLVERDIGHGFMSELLRRYHLAIFDRQFEQRKQVLEEFHKAHSVSRMKISTRVNNELLNETVFKTYNIMTKQVCHARVWTGLLESFGFVFLALVDLDVPKVQ